MYILQMCMLNLGSRIIDYKIQFPESLTAKCKCLKLILLKFSPVKITNHMVYCTISFNIVPHLEETGLL